MRGAVSRAMEARRSVGVERVATEEAVDRAIAAAGLGLRQDRRYAGRIQGRLFRRTVCVRHDLWPGQRLVVKAHELGHALLGHADGALFEQTRGGVDHGAVEAAAQVFAWTFLLGRPARTLAGLERQFWRGHAAGVPLDFLCAGLTILLRRR